jgi:hypothetical protein
MTITTNPSLARTDVAATPATAPAAGAAPLVRSAGALVTAGALIWAASMVTYGTTPADSLGITVTDLAALPFQIGLFALVTAQQRTRATGVSRVARGMLKAEYGLLALATLWTVLHGAVPAFRDDLWLSILDMFWPLSMLGMFVIGVKIVFTRRWRGPARVWPIIAESWAVVTVPSMAILGPSVAAWVGPAHLLLGYTVLGLILALRPHLTGARD